MRKDVVTRITLAALAIAGLWLAWAQNQPAPLTLQKVTENLYAIIGDGGNVAFMPTNEGVILVDDKFERDAPQIVAQVKSVTDKPIRYVLNTHQHGDHTGGNAAMMAANAEIIIQKNARANMLAGNMPGLPRITFSEESQVFLGGKEVLARHLGRGHTNGDAVIYFPSERVLHTGDLYVSSGALFCDTSAGGSIKDWEQTIQKSLQYDFDTVIPGHGALMKKADLAKWAQTVATVRERIRKACAGGAADALTRLDLSDLGMQTPGNSLFARGMPGMCKELAQ
ncbi:MAG TPA: MBL fold metallo-hydrolase [Bryobacteraceae bacterium]|nr:MBL fold metallo-hydrolase [Bryobacteraceae bacterium]